MMAFLGELWRQFLLYWHGANHTVHVEVISFRHFLGATHFTQKTAPLHHSRDDCELGVRLRSVLC